MVAFKFLFAVLVSIFLISLASAGWGSNVWETSTRQAVSIPINITSSLGGDTYQLAYLTKGDPASPPTWKDLMLWLPFDELTGINPKDKSPYGRTVANNYAVVSSGYWNQSFYFNGSSSLNVTVYDDSLIYDYDTLIAPATYDHPLCLPFWAKANKTGAMIMVSDWWQIGGVTPDRLGWEVGTSASNNITLTIGLNSGTSVATITTPINASTGWHHIVYCQQRVNSHTLWVDGVSYGTITDTMAYGTNRRFLIGGNKANLLVANYFTGWIDDMLLFSRMLSTNEILALNSTKSSGNLQNTNISIETNTVAGSFPLGTDYYSIMGYEVNKSYSVTTESTIQYALNTTSSCFYPTPLSDQNWYYNFNSNCVYDSQSFFINNFYGSCGSAVGGNLTLKSTVIQYYGFLNMSAEHSNCASRIKGDADSKIMSATFFALLYGGGEEES